MTVELDGDRHDNEYWQQHKEAERRSHNVQHALHHHRPVQWVRRYTAIAPGSHSASTQDRLHGGSDTIDFGVSHAGKQRQRNRTLEVAASDRKLALLAMIALLPVCHLMQWPIVDRCADTFLCKARDQIVAIGPRTLTDPYRKHVPGMKAAGGSGSRTVDRPIRQFP